MSLLPVKIVVPVSECSPAVRTQGQLTGASVRVMADGELVAEGTASSADMLVPLLPNVTLKAGQALSATQTLDGETSVEALEVVFVQASPPMLGPVNVGIVHRCSECIYVTGSLPGAIVKVTAQAGPLAGLRGEGDATQTLQVGIDPPVDQGETLSVHQEAEKCGLSGDQVFVQALSPPATLHPPSLDLDAPLKECQRAVRVMDVVPGAVVTIQRSAGDDVEACVSHSYGHIGVAPLQAGEILRVRQSLLVPCELVSEFSPRYVVEPAEPVKPPAISGAFDSCVHTTSLLLTELIPTAQVRILVDGDPIGLGEVPPNTTVFPFPLPGGTATIGTTLAAQQGLCNKWSPLSNEIVIQEGGEAVPAPEIPGPLHACGNVVRVRPNSGGWVTITVHSATLGAPIGQGNFWNVSGEVDVPVAPLLIAGDTITASIKGCGPVTETSAGVVVQNMPQVLHEPDIDVPPHLQEGMTSVPVRDVIPGAWVEVFVNLGWRGGAAIGGTHGQVPITGMLEVGDIVEARQRLCARMSRFSRRAQVMHKYPVAMFNAVPQSGETPLAVKFHNQSQHANHPTDPYRWWFDYKENDANIDPAGDSTEEHPEHTYSTPGTYQVYLLARNASDLLAAASKQIVASTPSGGTDTSWTVALNGLTPSGSYRPFVFTTPVKHNTYLKSIQNPSQYVLGFIKLKDGKGIDDCGKPSAVMLLHPGQAFSADDFEEIWGVKNPPLAIPSGQTFVGLTFLACVEAKGMKWPNQIQITYVETTNP
jgi:hypothetical protein